MASRPESPATASACTARRLRLRNSADVCAPRATAPAAERCSYSICPSRLPQLREPLERRPRSASGPHATQILLGCARERDNDQNQPEPASSFGANAKLLRTRIQDCRTGAFIPSRFAGAVGGGV